MTLTLAICSLKRAWLRVPLWSLYYPLLIVFDFIPKALCCAEGRARIVQADCWDNMFAMYCVGLEGWYD